MDDSLDAVLAHDCGAALEPRLEGGVLVGALLGDVGDAGEAESLFFVVYSVGLFAWRILICFLTIIYGFFFFFRLDCLLIFPAFVLLS